MRREKLQHQFMPENVIIPHFGMYDPIVGVEIGVLTGSGTLSMLKAIPGLTLYSIDPWLHLPDVPGEEHFETALPQEVLDENFRITKARTEEFWPRSILIRKFSDDAVKDVPDVIDYLFIDGDHCYKQVVKDLKNYAPKVKAGGIVAGHDYIKQMGVAQAVQEYFKGKEIHYGDDDTWWVEIE